MPCSYLCLKHPALSDLSGPTLNPASTPARLIFHLLISLPRSLVIFLFLSAFLLLQTFCSFPTYLELLSLSPLILGQWEAQAELEILPFWWLYWCPLLGRASRTLPSTLTLKSLLLIRSMLQDCWAHSSWGSNLNNANLTGPGVGHKPYFWSADVSPKVSACLPSWCLSHLQSYSPILKI